MNHLPSAGRRPSLFLHGKSKARWMNISQTFPLLSLAYTLIYIPICLSPPLFHLSSCVTLQSSSLDFIFFHSQLNLAFSLILPCSHNPSSVFSAFLYWLLPLNKETCCSVSNLLKNKEETRGGRGRQRKEKPSLDWPPHWRPYICPAFRARLSLGIPSLFNDFPPNYKVNSLNAGVLEKIFHEHFLNVCIFLEHNFNGRIFLLYD